MIVGRVFRGRIRRRVSGRLCEVALPWTRQTRSGGLVLFSASSTASLRRLRVGMLLLTKGRTLGLASSKILAAHFVRPPKVSFGMFASLKTPDYWQMAIKCFVASCLQSNHRSRRLYSQSFLTERDHPPVVINGDLHCSCVEIPTLPLNRIAAKNTHGTHGASKPV